MVQSCAALRWWRQRPPTNIAPSAAACDQMLQVETHDNLYGKLLLTPG